MCITSRAERERATTRTLYDEQAEDMTESTEVLSSCLNLMRRLPPKDIENSLAGLLNLVPNATDELLQRVDQVSAVGTTAPGGCCGGVCVCLVFCVGASNWCVPVVCVKRNASKDYSFPSSLRLTVVNSSSSTADFHNSCVPGTT